MLQRTYARSCVVNNVRHFSCVLIVHFENASLYTLLPFLSKHSSIQNSAYFSLATTWHDHNNKTISLAWTHLFIPSRTQTFAEVNETVPTMYWWRNEIEPLVSARGLLQRSIERRAPHSAFSSHGYVQVFITNHSLAFSTEIEKPHWADIFLKTDLHGLPELYNYYHQRRCLYVLVRCLFCK